MTFDKVATLLADQLGIDKSTIKMESRVIEDLKADSLDVVELLMTMEEEFDMAVSDEEAAKISTVADIVKIIDNN
ncbi:MAG: acyl carrier protein [Christensenellaceae bacterium]